MQRFLLGSTIGSEKSLFCQVFGVLIGGITLIVVPLLVLGKNQVQKCDSSFSKGVNTDEFSTSLKETISLKNILENYSSTHKHTLFLCLLLQTLDKWKDIFEN